MDAAGAREAALCTCLLSYWNSAPSANPFNSSPSVFVWADVQGLTYVKCLGLFLFCFVFFKCALCSCWLFSVLWKISPVLKTFPLRVFNLTLCNDALTFLFLPPSAKEEQCVSEVSGRAAAVGNSRWVTLQPWRCSVWVSNCLWEWKPFDLCDRLCMWGGGPSPPHAKTYRKSCQCLAALRAISGWAEDHRGLTYAVYRWYTNIRLCLLSSVELVPEKSVVERVKASDISSTAGKWAFWLD